MVGKLTCNELMDLQLDHYVEVFKPLFDDVMWGYVMQDSHEATLYLNEDLREEYGGKTITVDDEEWEKLEDEINSCYYLGYNCELEEKYPYCGRAYNDNQCLVSDIDNIILNGSLNILKLETSHGTDEYFLLLTREKYELTKYTMMDLCE